MVFSSTVFLFIFLPAVTAAYYVIGHALTRRMTVKNGILLAASLVFYAWGEPVYIVLMVISILFNYFIGRDIDLARQAGNARRAKTAFIFAIVFALLIKLTILVLAVTVPNYPMIVSSLADTGLTLLLVGITMSLLHRKVR